MSVSIFLSNNDIQVVVGSWNSGRVKIDNMFNIHQDEGVMVNGVFVDEEKLQEMISYIWDKYNLTREGVRFIVANNQFRFKNIEVPQAMKDAECRNIVFRELEISDEEREQSMADFMELGDKNGARQILGMVVEKSVVSGYVEFFRKMDIELASVTSYLVGGLRVVRSLSLLENSTSIIMKLNGESLGSILLEEGQYKNYMQRRLFYDRGSEDFAREIGRHINNTMQFQSGADSKPIEHVYFCGFEQEDVECCRETVALLGYQAEELSLGELVTYPEGFQRGEDSDIKLGAYMESIGNLMDVDDHDVNFCSELAEENARKAKAEKKERFAKYKPYAVTAGVCLAITLIMLAVWGVQTFRYNQAMSFINNEDNQLDSARAQKAEILRSMYEADKQNLVTAKDNLKTYPDVDSLVASKVSKLGEGYDVTASISSYDAESGVMIIAATSKTEENIHGYIRKLEEQEKLFTRVDYSGYSLNSQTGEYTINVNCTMKGETVN